MNGVRDEFPYDGEPASWGETAIVVGGVFLLAILLVACIVKAVAR